MLPKLDEYGTVFLQHFQSPLGAASVACIQKYCFFVGVIALQVESLAIAATTGSVHMNELEDFKMYSLTHTAKVDMTLAVRSTALYPCLISSDKRAALTVKALPAAASWTALSFRFLSNSLIGCPGVLKALR